MKFLENSKGYMRIELRQRKRERGLWEVVGQEIERVGKRQTKKEQ